MDWRQQAFGAMRERTFENAQLYLLVNRYDLSKESRLAKEIVHIVNARADADERRRGIQRVRPGEMLLQTSRGNLILPIRTGEVLDRAISGEPLQAIREDIVHQCIDRYRELFPNAREQQIRGLIRALQIDTGFRQSRVPDHGINYPRPKRPFGPVNRELIEGLLVDAQRGKENRPSDSPRPGYSAEVVLQLCDFIGQQAGVPPAVREPMILDLLRLRARFCPRVNMLDSGQMPLATMHVETGRTLHRATRFQPIAPVVVTLIASGELKQLQGFRRWPYAKMMQFHARRMARVLVEAYQQDGLISHAELQWCFLASISKIGRILDWYQRTNNVILPCPGSVLDMGRMMTHKDIIVRLHLQGMSVLEISRQTYHAPRSVDAYLRAFDAILILHLYGLPAELAARVLGSCVSVVNEYLSLVDEYLKDPEQMRGYLRDRGVKIPVVRLQSAPC